MTTDASCDRERFATCLRILPGTALAGARKLIDWPLMNHHWAASPPLLCVPACSERGSPTRRQRSPRLKWDGSHPAVISLASQRISYADSIPYVKLTRIPLSRSVFR